ncbi:MAG: efflux RND transporter periplasmic adaptor subunit [Elusimicrobiota bacterium]|nr:efflux RND transporter periplasmic adaptor subunit [Elusimicrobiota bacterium]
MKKIIISVVVLILIAGGIFLFKKKKKNNQLTEIQPTRDSIAVEFRATGTVSPRNRLEIKPQVSGRIEDVLVVEGQNVKKGEVIAWMSSTDRAALLDVAREKGDAEFQKWSDAYKPTPIISPLDGFIIVRNKEPGQSVPVSDVILVMADKLIIEAIVDETDLRYMKLGQDVKIFLDAYPDKYFSGTIEHIAYESTVINNVTVYKVKIKPENPPSNFRSGMTATIEVTSDKRENVLLLPSDVIVEKGNRKFVNIKTKNGKTELKEVSVGISDGKKTEITEGITEDDIILSSAKVSKRDRTTQMRMGGIPGIGGGRTR